MVRWNRQIITHLLLFSIFALVLEVTVTVMKKYPSSAFLAFAVAVGSFTTTLILPHDYPLFLNPANAQQADIRNGYVWITLPSTGNQDDSWSCGPNSAARVLAFYRHRVNYGQVRAVSQRDKGIIPSKVCIGSGVLKSCFDSSSFKTGFEPWELRDVMNRWETGKANYESGSELGKLKSLLSQGKPVLVLRRVGSIKPGRIFGTWPEMHWVAVHGFNDRARKIYFTDTDGGTYEKSYDEFLSEWDWRIGDGLASETLYKKGIKPKTIVWVDRTPPSLASSSSSSTSFTPNYDQLNARAAGCYYIRSLNNNFRNSNFRWLDAKSDGTGVGLVNGRSHGTVWLLEETNQGSLLRSTNQNHRSIGNNRWLDGMSNGTGVQLVSDTSHGAFWKLEQAQGGYLLMSLNNNFRNNNFRWLDGASNGNVAQLVNGKSHGTLWELTSTSCP